MNRKISALVLAAILAASAVGMTACTGKGGGSAESTVAQTNSVESEPSVVSNIDVTSGESVESKAQEINGDTSVIDRASTGGSDGGSVEESDDPSEVSVISNTPDTSETSEGTGVTAESTAFGRYILTLKDGYEAGKKIVMKSQSYTMTMYKVDGKDCMVMDAASSSSGDVTSLLGGYNIMVSDGKYLYLINGESYYKVETSESVTEEWKGITDAFDTVVYVKNKNGYEYFKVDDDDELTDTLVAKVESNVCYVYQGSIDNLYATIEYTDVTAEDKALVDISRYKETTEEFADIEDIDDDIDAADADDIIF